MMELFKMSLWDKFGQPDITDFGGKFFNELSLEHKYGLIQTFWQQYHMKSIDFLRDQAILLNFEFNIAYKELKQKLVVPSVGLYLEEI